MKGSLKDIRPDDLSAQVLTDLMSKVPAVTPDHIDDLLMGCGQPAGESGHNIGRATAVLLGWNGGEAHEVAIGGSALKEARGREADEMCIRDRGVIAGLVIGDGNDGGLLRGVGAGRLRARMARATGGASSCAG